MREIPARLIAKKRDGLALTRDEIQDLVSGVVDQSLEDAQLGALLMAMFLRGADFEETGYWTEAMRDSGIVHRLDSVPGRKVDKHSTGGVGDKVSLVLAPLVASCGVPVPMVSGRGLGHTGGTVDKLESIPGFRMLLSPQEYERILSETGLVMSAATKELAPADARMYATRDVTGTVECIPWITSSILAKKLAEGIDGLVLDVKCGRGAFMKELAPARELARFLVETATRLGCECCALITDMDQVLGSAVGNALEVRESLECLQGQGPADLREISLQLGAEMLCFGQVCDSREAARLRLEAALADGSALARFRQMVEAQGGDLRVVDDPEQHLPQAPEQAEVTSTAEAYVIDQDPLAIAWVALELGAGRKNKGEDIDPAVGIECLVAHGDKVLAGQPLFRVHARRAKDLERACAELPATIRLGDESPAPRPLVLERILPSV
ncbi:MAG: thymidine phosphorylase [Planctomycetota bacterium]|nr:MAG: thymidine phosphorylase [Planctomycetota bacterium]